VVGLKPTHGSIPGDGCGDFEPHLTDLGPLTRTVRQSAELLAVLGDGQAHVLDGLDEGPQGLRLGVLREGFAFPGESDPEVDRVVRDAIATLASAGARATEVSVPMHLDGIPIWSGIVNEGLTQVLVDNGVARPTDRQGSIAEYMDAYAEALRSQPDRFPPSRMVALTLGVYLAQDPSRRRYSVSLELAQQLRREYDTALAVCDVLVMPTTPRAAHRRPAGARSFRETLADAAGPFHNAAPFNATGHPALSVPCGDVEGRPVGLMIVGRHGRDDLVLRVGAALEKRLGQGR
jgi:amidase